MGKDLVISKHYSRLYGQMQTAVSACHSVDDCKQISDQASAVAAYFKQIKDDESVRKFKEIKLRAWRRIGEIITGAVANDGCETQAAYIRKIRAQIATELSDSHIYLALRLMTVPSDFFEKNADQFVSVDALIVHHQMEKEKSWKATPEGQAEAKRRQQEIERTRKLDEEHAKAEAERQKQEHEQRQETEKLLRLQAEAFSEVGVTMDRRDREQMAQIVLLIRREIHDVLRQAAFDERMTMQAILRSGLAMWFAAHNYDVPMGLTHDRRGRSTAKTGADNLGGRV